MNDDYEQGELVRRTYSVMRPGDSMDVYSFQGWAECPPSPLSGRVAFLRWEHNGTPAAGYESELTNDCAECGEWLSDAQSGCDTCAAFTRKAKR